MQPVHYIIPTAGIGGAEKRFIELWCYLNEHQKQFDLRLIISEQLQEAISKNETLQILSKPYAHKIKTYLIDFNLRVIEFQQALYDVVCLYAAPTDILHFILSYPTFIYRLKHHKILYSLTESSFKNVNIKGKLLYLMNICRSTAADILDPVVHGQVRKWLFFKKNKIYLTPGSFVDASVFKPAENYQKENWFVYLGRFFWVKQVLELLKTLPEVCQKIDASGLGIKDYKFIFLGYGHQEEEVKAMLSQPEYRSLPIEVKMAHKPEEILARSKIFFSLQLRNNYPSKSLLEGVAAGNIPLVTDVGTTRMIADPAFSYYVPEYFSADAIAEQLITILSLDENSLQAKMKAARQFIVDHFTIQASASYYLKLYHKL